MPTIEDFEFKMPRDKDGAPVFGQENVYRKAVYWYAQSKGEHPSCAGYLWVERAALDDPHYPVEDVVLNYARGFVGSLLEKVT